jgi:hypothetical protein
MTSQQWFEKRMTTGGWACTLDRFGLTDTQREMVEHLIRWAYEDGRRDEWHEKTVGVEMDTEILYGEQA